MEFEGLKITIRVPFKDGTYDFNDAHADCLATHAPDNLGSAIRLAEELNTLLLDAADQIAAQYLKDQAAKFGVPLPEYDSGAEVAP